MPTFPLLHLSQEMMGAVSRKVKVQRSKTAYLAYFSTLENGTADVSFEGAAARRVLQSPV